MSQPMRRGLSLHAFGLALLATMTSTILAEGQPSDLPPPPPPETSPEAPPPLETGPQSPTPPDAAPLRIWRPMMRAGAGVEGSWFSTKNVDSTFTLIPYGAFELSKALLLDLHVPFAFATETPPGQINGKAGAGLGNPTIGLMYVTTDARTTWHVGARVSLPVAGLSDAQPWLTANLYGAVAMTLWDLHYWAYKYVPLGLRGGVEYQAKPNIFMRTSIDPTLFVPTSDQSALVSQRKAVFLYQLRLEIEGRGESGWGGGVGLQVVHLVSEKDSLGPGDNAQGAIEPFVSYDSKGPFARIGVLVALDQPLGFGFDKEKVATLRAHIGSHF